MEKYKVQPLRYIFDSKYREAINLLRNNEAVSAIMYLVDEQGKNTDRATINENSTEEEKAKFNEFRDRAPIGTKMKLTLLNRAGQVVYDIDATKK